MLRQPEAVAYQTLHAIAVHGVADCARGDRQSEARVPELIRADRQREVTIAKPAGLLIDGFELRRLAQPLHGSETQFFRPAQRRYSGRSGNQTLAALGATARQHLASVSGSHAGAEAMCALAADLARLVCTFHVSRL